MDPFERHNSRGILPSPTGLAVQVCLGLDKGGAQSTCKVDVRSRAPLQLRKHNPVRRKSPRKGGPHGALKTDARAHA